MIYRCKQDVTYEERSYGMKFKAGEMLELHGCGGGDNDDDDDGDREECCLGY